MAYKTMKLVVGPDMVDYHINKVACAIQNIPDVDLEVSLKPLNNAQVQIKVKVLKFTREITWQDIAAKLSQQLMGINVLLVSQSPAICSNSKSVILR